MIEGVKLIPLTTHTDERGFFREVLKAGQCEFGQWSHSMMVTSTIKAWHIHQKQTDYFYVPVGIVKVVLCEIEKVTVKILGDSELITRRVGDLQEFIIGENYCAQVLVIPPGVAHGLKVLQGPAHLFYITSREYDPADEGRIPYDALGYDWFKQDIK